MFQVGKKRSHLPSELRELQRTVKKHEELQKELMEIAPYVGIVKNLEESKRELEKEVENTLVRFLFRCFCALILRHL